MTENSFWTETLQAPVFWEAFSSIATLVAVIVALLVPYAKSQSRFQRACKLVVAELQNNREALNRFDDLSDMLRIHRQGDEAYVKIGEKTLQFFDDAAVTQKKLSTRDPVWHKIPADRVACYKQAYDMFGPAVHPEFSISFGDDASIAAGNQPVHV